MKRFSISIVIVLLSLLVSSQASAQAAQYSFFPNRPTPTDLTEDNCWLDERWIGNSLLASESGQITELSIYYPGETYGGVSGSFVVFTVEFDISRDNGEGFYLVSTVYESPSINIPAVNGWHTFSIPNPIQISTGSYTFLPEFPYTVTSTGTTYLVSFHSEDTGFRTCYLGYSIYDIYNNLDSVGSPINFLMALNGSGSGHASIYYPSLWGPEWGGEVAYPIDIIFEPNSAPPSGEDGAFDVNLDFDAIFTNASDFANGMWPVLAIAVGLQLSMVVLVLVMRRIKQAINIRH